MDSEDNSVHSPIAWNWIKAKRCMSAPYHRSFNQFFRHQSTAENIFSFLCYGKLFQRHSSRYCSYFTLAFYLPIHDIDLYCAYFRYVRPSPKALFKRWPSVCLHHVVINVPECGRGHCVHLHGDSVCYSEQGNEQYLKFPYIYKSYLSSPHQYRINLKKFLHPEDGSSKLHRSIGILSIEWRRIRKRLSF